MNFLKKFLANQSGATAVEYGLIAALMAAALIGGLGTFTNGMQGVFGTIENNLTIR
ncbi:pilus assembly protein Flp/PilA [Rhizobium sp. BK650]|uniref:Flp family type IVb pilin n=1 Tax=Rhizobium sp. BK650 TaxID=2586990 RepID=UPI001614CA00|nr:Flp family type IVb pilin [Rhizobium sp. BK650]MBB3658985.1 pilus assembly protein Flp/PilA [Rhizobium sp. BK650]